MIRYLEEAIRIGQPFNLIVWTNDQPPKLVSLFSLVGNKDIYSLYSEYINQAKFNNEGLTAAEIAIAWATIQSQTTNTANTNEFNSLLLSLYRQVSVFISRVSPSEYIDEIMYDRLIREYISLYKNGASADQNAINVAMLNKLVRDRDYMENTPAYGGGEVFKFDILENGLVLKAHTKEPIDSFNDIVVSKFVPFASLTTATQRHRNERDVKRLFKYYNNIDSVPTLLPPDSWIDDTNIDNTLSCKIFYRKYMSDSNYNNKAAYSTLIHPLNSNTFSMEYSPRNAASIDEIVRRVSDAFPSVRFTREDNDANISGSFIVRSLLLDKSVLGDVVSVDPILRNFISLNEAQKPLSLKERTALHIIIYPFLHITATFNTVTTTQNEIVRTDKNTNVRLMKGEKYIRVQLSGIPNSTYVQWAQDTILKILTIYNARYDVVVNAYAQVFGAQWTPVAPIGMVNDTMSGVQKNVELTKLEKLQSEDPDMFIPSYASKVQSTSQPKWIPKDKVQYYLSKGVQVVRFPAYITNSDKQVNNLGNKENYYISDTPNKPYLGLIENDIENCVDYPYLLASYKEKSLTVDTKTWNITINVQRTGKKNGGTKGYILDVNKILQPERRGEIKTRIALLLSDRYKRLGMPQSTSSFMHCIYFAKNKAYASEDVIRQERINMIRTVHPEVAAQERYDDRVEDIVSDIMNVDGYVLNPFTDYRLLEEYYNVKIYTFTLDEETDEPILEVPRHKHYHARMYNAGRQNIVFVYKHKINIDHGSSGVGSCNEYTIPIHCELLTIPPRTKKGKDYTTFDDANTVKKMEDLMKSFSQVDKIHIDSYPSQDVTTTTNVNVIDYAQSPIAGLTNLSRQTIDVNGRVSSIDLATGDTLRLNPHLPPLNIPSVYESRNDGPTSALTARKKAAIMKAVIGVLLVLSKETKSQFSDRIVVDASTKYDVMDVPRIFPYFSSLNEALEYFRQHTPSLIPVSSTGQWRVVADSDKLAMGMKTFVRSNYATSISNHIADYYHDPSDFTMWTRYQTIFNDESVVRRFFNYIHSEDQLKHNKLHISPQSPLRIGQEPYVITNANKHYLAQSVLAGDKLRALMVARTWTAYKINLGFYAVSTITSDNANIEIPVIESYDDTVLLSGTTVARVGDQYMALLQL